MVKNGIDKLSRNIGKELPLLATVFNFPQNVGERFNIHSKILKKPFPICCQLREKVVIFTTLFSQLINFMNPDLSLLNFKRTFSEAIRTAASSLVRSIIATGLQSAPIIGLHPRIPTCR